MMRHSLVSLLTLGSLALSVTARPAHAFGVQGGIKFVAVLGAAEGTELALDDSTQHELQRGHADQLGSLVFLGLVPGPGYRVRTTEAGGESHLVTVLDFAQHPGPTFYQAQTLVDGFQYIQTRDGTLLSAMVRPPLGKTMADGPFPTVVEYSGYSVSDPGATEPSSLISSFLGYATVGVNMRGSGCSGGVIDLFDLPTTADGYDIIETVAAQSWVMGGKVGMVGISFPGISQLFVGGARPPHLAAIAPLSVIGDIYQSPGFPGGIFNNGFAKSWLQERKDNAEPAPDGGQRWARRRVNNGDEVCRSNQRLRLQTIDPVAYTVAHPFYVPELMDNRSPIMWVENIEVPTFLAGGWQDEQTGPGFAQMLSKLPKRRDVKIMVSNGVHTTSLDPEILWNWCAFLDLYVAHRIPDPSRIAPIVSLIAAQILGNGAPTPPTPSDPYDHITTYADAKRYFEGLPHVRALMENGAGSPTPGLPASTFQLNLGQWPASLRPAAWYFGPNGTLSRSEPHDPDSAIDQYRPDPALRPKRSLPDGARDSSWDVIPAYQWAPLAAGASLAYATPPLDRDIVIAGPSSVDLWLRSSAPDTDLQLTLTEIRPDGLETFVQGGWLRASRRKLNRATSSALDPRPTHLEVDASPLPAGEFSKVRVGLFSVTHVFRKGSRIRLSLDAPGGNRTIWQFDTPETNGAVLNEIARSAAKPSRIVLPVIPVGQVPQALPPCPGLRGQPCRTYVAASNGG